MKDAEIMRRRWMIVLSACDGTARIVLVCRTILLLAHLISMFRRVLVSVFEHLSAAQDARW
jgi:hypothetical protein